MHTRTIDDGGPGLAIPRNIVGAEMSLVVPGTDVVSGAGAGAA
jgi:hypothetical protein